MRALSPSLREALATKNLPAATFAERAADLASVRAAAKQWVEA